MAKRKETDALGELYLDEDVYYGIQTERAKVNFPVSGRTIAMFPKMIWSIAAIKKCAAMANRDIGMLDPEIADSICKAVDEVMNGEMSGQFPIDIYHGGGGTSLNMNVNEVIANRANEILTGAKGYDRVHPNTHVNMGQSTNDVIPSALQIACYLTLNELIPALERLDEAVGRKAQQFSHVVKLARTCLQDAVPITLGQQFSGYLGFVRRQMKEIKSVQQDCFALCIGATAVGTELGTAPGYIESVYKYLPQVLNLPVYKSDNFFDSLQNADTFVKISSTLKGVATGLSKIASDLRLMSSGPRGGLNEINLPPVQPGSSIMPGKVNPVIPEMVMQVCFQVYGNDLAVTLAADQGELDLNVWESLIMKNILESGEILTNAIRLLADNCIDGIEANEAHSKMQADSTLAVSMVLSSLLGYEGASDIAKDAYERGYTIKEAVVRRGVLTPEEADKYLDSLVLTDPDKNREIFLKHAEKQK